MDNSFRKNQEYDQLSNKNSTQGEQEKSTGNLKVSRKVSSPKRDNKKSSFIPKKFSLLDELKPVNDDTDKEAENEHKSSIQEDPKRKMEKREKKKKDGVNRKFIRKNAKKANSPKKKREGNNTNKIKVVGTVSAKLAAFIKRLEQNTTTTENTTTNNQFGDKVVMAPRIKAALEKFNKKKEEKLEIIHYGGKAYRRKKASIDQNVNKENNINNTGNKEGSNNENNDNNDEEEEEYEYEEFEDDEEYEEEEEEEEEEEKENDAEKGEILRTRSVNQANRRASQANRNRRVSQVNRRASQITRKKSFKKSKSRKNFDDDQQNNILGKQKSKKDLMDISKDNEDDNDENSYTFDENGQKN